MSLLVLENVSKLCRDGPRERAVLRDVTLELAGGELAVVWGLRRSGRSTLLRIAAGIESPDGGAVRLEGRDLARHGEDLVGGRIGYCQMTFRAAAGHTVFDQVVGRLLGRGIAPAEARSRARGALERTGAERCAGLRPLQLDSAEAVRVALARTLALRPRLLVIDEPVKGVELAQRDGILLLLRSLADEGITVFASTGDSPGLTGADRGFTLGDGELHASPAPRLAPVLPLRRAAG
jgi:predicted ABC-type transport system involved in lysophospholipase L1 biosynthesis ATPase subunit